MEGRRLLPDLVGVIDGVLGAFIGVQVTCHNVKSVNFLTQRKVLRDSYAAPSLGFDVLIFYNTEV